MRYLLGLAACAALAVPASAAADPERLARIDDAVNEGIARGDCPGAVVAVLHNGETVYREAFGKRAVIGGVSDRLPSEEDSGRGYQGRHLRRSNRGQQNRRSNPPAVTRVEL